MEKHIYTTLNGREVEYKAISLDALKMSRMGIERAFREKGEPLDPPTYEIETASGAKVKENHDATTVKTEEEITAWAAYTDARRRMDYEYSRILTRYVLDDGLADIQLPEDDQWQQKYKDRYIELPVDPNELRDFYLTTEILPTQTDIEGLLSSVLLLSEYGKVDPDALEARLELFRYPVERKAAKRAKPAKKQVDAQPEVDGA